MGLSSADLGTYLTTLAGSHDVAVRFRVLDLSGTYLGTVDAAEPGQVNGDATADVPLSLTGVTLLDFDGLLDGAGMDRMIQVVYSVNVPGLGRTVDCEVFTGPVIRPPGRGPADEVSVECQSMEAVAARATTAKTYPAGNAVGTIQQILSEKCGQTRFAFPSLRDKLEDRVQVGAADQLRPLVQCRAIARSLDRHLFCDGAGVWRLREYPAAPVADLTGMVTAREPSDPPSEIVNQWRVVGKTPKTMTVVIALPVSHPFSPESLAVGGVRSTGVFEQAETNSKLNTRAKVISRANRLYNQGTAALVERTIYDIVPVPNLQLHDPVRFAPDIHTLTRFSLPLGSSGQMTVGYDKPLASRRRGRRLR